MCVSITAKYLHKVYVMTQLGSRLCDRLPSVFSLIINTDCTLHYDALYKQRLVTWLFQLLQPSLEQSATAHDFIVVARNVQTSVSIISYRFLLKLVNRKLFCYLPGACLPGSMVMQLSLMISEAALKQLCTKASG